MTYTKYFIHMYRFIFSRLYFSVNQHPSFSLCLKWQNPWNYGLYYNCLCFSNSKQSESVNNLWTRFVSEEFIKFLVGLSSLGCCSCHLTLPVLPLWWPSPAAPLWDCPLPTVPPLWWPSPPYVILHAAARTSAPDIDLILSQQFEDDSLALCCFRVAVGNAESSPDSHALMTPPI